jgi:CheY-like chemotaxis protein/tetratricopeptide (TPR) repeat protein
VAKQHLLIVDSDPKSLRLLEVSLKKAGFSVTRATDGADAIEKIKISTPDMIISETKMPNLNGFELNSALKGNPEWADIPVMFLTAQKSIEDKIRSLEEGVEDYLTKPIFIREILARVSLVMQRRQRESLENRSSKTNFSGNLSDMGIIDLIQTIDISRKSGIIHVNWTDDAGDIIFKDGKVIDAKTSSRKGEEAVYRMLVWSDGTFEIEFKPIEQRSSITLSTQGLLMEGMRRLDEWGRLQEQLPPLTSIFDVDDKILAERLGEIPDEINSLLRHFDGKRNLLEIVNLCPLGDLETLTIISKLYFEGLIVDITTLEPDDASDSAGSAADFWKNNNLFESQPPESYEEDYKSSQSASYSDEKSVVSVEASADNSVADKAIKDETTEGETGASSTLRLPRMDILPGPESISSESGEQAGFVAALSKSIPPTSPDDEAILGHEDLIDQKSHTPTDPPPSSDLKPADSLQKDQKSAEGFSAEYKEKSDEKNQTAHVDGFGEDNPSEETDEEQRETDEPKGENEEEQIISKRIETSTTMDLSDYYEEEKEKRGEIFPLIIKTAATVVVAAAVAAGAYWLFKKNSIKDFDSAPVIRTALSDDAAGQVDKKNVKSNKKQPVESKAQKSSHGQSSTLVAAKATGAEIKTEKIKKTVTETDNSAESSFSQLPPLTEESKAEYENQLRLARKQVPYQKIKTLKKAIEINPNGEQALAELSILMMEKRRVQKEALEYAQRAVKINPDNGKAWLAIGYINQLMGNKKEAKEAYKNCASCTGPMEFVRDCKLMVRNY